VIEAVQRSVPVGNVDSGDGRRRRRRHCARRRTRGPPPGSGALRIDKDVRAIVATA